MNELDKKKDCYKKNHLESRFLNEQFKAEEERRDKDDNAKFRRSWRSVIQTGDALLRANVAKRTGVQPQRDER